MSKFPPIPDDWGKCEQEKEVYARFGLAVYFAQCFEHSIVNLILSANLAGARGEVESKEHWDFLIDDILDNSFQKTLGNMLKSLSEIVDIDERTEKALREAKSNRDFLCHRFFREHAEDFITSGGRMRMMERLEILGKQIDSAMEIVDLMQSATMAHLGITPELVEETYQKYLEEVRTDG